MTLLELSHAAFLHLLSKSLLSVILYYQVSYIINLPVLSIIMFLVSGT